MAFHDEVTVKEEYPLNNIWIVATNAAHRRTLQSSLSFSDRKLSFFPSWEAVINELIHYVEEDHPDFLFLEDHGADYSLSWLPLLKDCLASKCKLLLFGEAKDLSSMSLYYQRWGIIDYLGLPLFESKLRLRFELITGISA